MLRITNVGLSRPKAQTTWNSHLNIYAMKLVVSVARRLKLLGITIINKGSGQINVVSVARRLKLLGILGLLTSVKVKKFVSVARRLKLLGIIYSQFNSKKMKTSQSPEGSNYLE